MMRALATLGYIGLLRPAPGTWGSAAAIPLAWPVWWAGGWVALLLGAVLLFVLGTYATAQISRETGDADPSEVVIDELVGQWIAILPVVLGATHAGVGFWALWPGLLTGFIAFRAFDIFKPGPIGWADRRGDPLGVMLDDVLAGIAAALVVALGAGLAHGV